MKPVLKKLESVNSSEKRTRKPMQAKQQQAFVEKAEEKAMQEHQPIKQEKTVGSG